MSRVADLLITLDELRAVLGTTQIIRELEILERDDAHECQRHLDLTIAADHLERAGYLRAALAGLDEMDAIPAACPVCGATRTEVAHTGHRRPDGHACPEVCTCRPEHVTLEEHRRSTAIPVSLPTDETAKQHGRSK